MMYPNKSTVEIDAARSVQNSKAKIAQYAAGQASNMAQLYPNYYKDVSHISVIDVYGVHQLFNVNDPSGCLQHASKKILLSGVRTGGKSMFKDIKEARDTLTRWLELHPETKD